MQRDGAIVGGLSLDKLNFFKWEKRQHACELRRMSQEIVKDLWCRKEGAELQEQHSQVGGSGWDGISRTSGKIHFR